MPWAGQLKCCKMLKMIFWAIFLKTGHRIVLFFGMSIEADGLYDLAKTIYAWKNWFCMKLEGMVGHKIGLAAISWKFWFFQNGGILHAKITFFVNI